MIHSPTPKIGFVRDFAIGVPFWTIAEHGARLCAREHGATLAVRHYTDNLDMAAAIQALIAQQVDAIIVAAISPDHPDFLAALAATTTASIPVVAVDMPVSYPVACQVQSDNLRGSRMGAAYLVDRMGTQGVVLHLQGELGGIVAQMRSAGVHQVLDQHPGIQIIETDQGRWSRDVTHALLPEVVAAHPTIRGVIAANDQMALGALDALADVGRRDQVVAVGIDGDPDALLALQAGTLTATIARSPVQLGRTAVTTALDLIKGRDVPPEVLLDDMTLVTSETVAQVAIESLRIMPGIIDDLMTNSAALSVERTALRTIIDSLPDLIYVKTRDGRFEIANQAMAQLLGVENSDALIGKTDTDLFPRDLTDQYAADEQTLFESGRPVVNKEELVLAHDGSERWIITTKVPLRDAHGQVTRLVGRGQDITERRAAEHERLRLQEELIRAQAIALEELSTPLIPISDTVVVMPLIGRIDARRAGQIMETLLTGIQTQQADIAILDITGVNVVDTHVANALIQAARAVKLLGAHVILTGLRPEVAQTLIHLGVDLHEIITHGTLQSGISYALRRQ